MSIKIFNSTDKYNDKVHSDRPPQPSPGRWWCSGTRITGTNFSLVVVQKHTRKLLTETDTQYSNDHHNAFYFNRIHLRTHLSVRCHTIMRSELQRTLTISEDANFTKYTSDCGSSSTPHEIKIQPLRTSQISVRTILLLFECTYNIRHIYATIRSTFWNSCWCHSANMTSQQFN